MHVGIVAAFPAEGQCLTDARLRPQTALDLVNGSRLELAGLGPVNAAAAAERLIAHGSKCLVSWGMAAGIDPGLQPGRVCLPTHVLTEDGTAYETDVAWRESLQAHLDPMQPVSGTLFQSSQIVATTQEKSSIREQYRAVALDMESGAVAEIAARSGLPFLAIRAIADDATTTLPEAARHAMDSSGRVHFDIALRLILRSPGDLGRMWAVSKGYRAAQHALRQVALLAGSRLGAPINQTEGRNR